MIRSEKTLWLITTCRFPKSPKIASSCFPVTEDDLHVCSLTAEEVTDLKRQAVEEMMDRIKKGVHLRPVNQTARPKAKVRND